MPEWMEPFARTIDAARKVVHPRLAGLSKHVDLKLVSRLELGSGAVALRYEPNCIQPQERDCR